MTGSEVDFNKKNIIEAISKANEKVRLEDRFTACEIKEIVKEIENKCKQETHVVNSGDIQEIVDNANVAKGTFYLYFKDKYEIRDVLITKKSEKLFSDALASLRKNYISNFSDQIIYVINYVIDELNKNQILLKFISKNLSWGVYNKTLWTIYETNEEKGDTLYELFITK